MFPSKRRLDSTEGNANARKAHVRGQTLSGDTPRRQSLPVININKTVDEHLATIDETDSVAINTPWDENNVTESPAVHRHYHDDFPSTALSIEDTETENSHVISPVMTSDSQVLTDYLSTMSTDGCGIRLIRPIRVGGNGRVLFTAVQKRPIGLIISPNPSYTNCQIIEKLLEPWTEQLIDLYFQKVNICFPLLDEASFRSQFATAKERISPALLSAIYAHVLVYWKSDPQLVRQRPPDGRFICNLASEALHSELFTSPGISSLTAIILNIAGRPTTALIGNGVRLGSAVSLAYSLGLNHDPLSWDISRSEKMLRMHIWWSLLIYDRWSSLAHGTPPHIQRSFYDVPQPKIEYRLNQSKSQRDISALSVFVALSGLTDVLDYYLQNLYRVDRESETPISNLELRLDRWIESLEDNIRQIITRGTSMSVPGAPNLRLAYLSLQLLTHRIRMENYRRKGDLDEDGLASQYIQIRRTGEEIVLLVRELDEEQLEDFWLPVNAFAFPSTVTFLLRCALETEKSPNAIAKSNFFKLAQDLITALRRHRDSSGWDLGDICLAQQGEIVEKLASRAQNEESNIGITSFEDIIIPDDLFINEILTSF